MALFQSRHDLSEAIAIKRISLLFSSQNFLSLVSFVFAFFCIYLLTPFLLQLRFFILARYEKKKEKGKR